MNPDLYSPLANNITVINTGLLGDHLVACYLVEAGDQAAIVETGNYQSVERILALLDERQLSVDQVRYVFITHVHLDHAGGASALLDALPNAQLVVHPSGYKHMHDPANLINAATAVYGHERFQAMYGDIHAIDESRLIAAPDGTVIDLNGRLLSCFDSPGHAYHHMCIWDEQSRSWFTGDTFGICYGAMRDNGRPMLIPTTTPTQFDPEALKKSVRMLLAKQPEFMYLTHYGALAVDDWMEDWFCQQVDDYVRLTLEHGATMSDHRDLKPVLLEYSQQLAEQAAINMTPEKIADELAMDLELNSQGLYYWYQKHHG